MQNQRKRRGLGGNLAVRLLELRRRQESTNGKEQKGIGSLVVEQAGDSSGGGHGGSERPVTKEEERNQEAQSTHNVEEQREKVVAPRKAKAKAARGKKPIR